MSSAFTDRNNPFGDSRHNQVCHIPGIQFIHQMAPVCIDRIGRDTKFLGYLLRILTLGDAFQHIEFTQGQLFTPPFVRTLHLCAHMFGIRAIVRFAIQHTANGFGYFCRINGFKQNTVYRALYQVLDKPDFLVHGIHNDTRLRVFLPYSHNDIHP